jgi:hypothetical protein
MSDTSITPNIEVTIGRQTRLYHAFVTTAPATLDAPPTLTLYAGPLKDVAGFAVDTVALEALRAATPSRLVLIDTTELGWQRARSDRERIDSRRPSRVWSASIPCSSGSGKGCRSRSRQRTHERQPLRQHEQRANAQEFRS